MKSKILNKIISKIINRKKKNVTSKKYLNVFNKLKKKKEAFDVASRVRHMHDSRFFFHPNDNIINNNKYINFSFNKIIGAEHAPVVLMVRHQSDKLDLSSERIPDSNPGWSDSASFSKNKLKESVR